MWCSVQASGREVYVCVCSREVRGGKERQGDMISITDPLLTLWLRSPSGPQSEQRTQLSTSPHPSSHHQPQ